MSCRGGGRGGRFGGGRGFGRGRGGRGCDMGPPASVVEAGYVSHPCEGEAVVKLTLDKFGKGDELYIDPMKRLPLERSFPQPKASKTAGGGGRGGGRGESGRFSPGRSDRSFGRGGRGGDGERSLGRGRGRGRF